MKRPVPARSCLGFTLVELLVVIAIVGVLVALLMPAVQQSREAARKNTCRSNLRQIGIALQSYTDIHSVLPAGAYFYSFGSYSNGSILVRLLPFLEQDSLYREFNFDRPPVDNQVASTGKLLAARTVPVYRCPSDGWAGWKNSAVSFSSYAASNGSVARINNGSCSCANPPPWNSLALSPYDDPTNFSGPFSRRGIHVRPKDITDGLGKTIFFGESLPECSIHARQGWVSSNNMQGFASTIIPINFDSCRESGDQGCRRYCNWNTETGFKSRHPGGAFFLMGDGSVDFLSEAVNMRLFQFLGAKSDGSTTSGL
jgi:prepilin-type N-terminal cleavage/methylation domain-containing protein